MNDAFMYAEVIITIVRCVVSVVLGIGVIVAGYFLAKHLHGRDDGRKIAEEYFVMFGNQGMGPYDANGVIYLIQSGQVFCNTLIRKTGSDGWIQAQYIPEFRCFFQNPQC